MITVSLLCSESERVKGEVDPGPFSVADRAAGLGGMPTAGWREGRAAGGENVISPGGKIAPHVLWRQRWIVHRLLPGLNVAYLARPGDG